MKGCRTAIKFGKFSWRMSVQESGDRITVPSKTKREHPGECTEILVVRADNCVR